MFIIIIIIIIVIIHFINSITKPIYNGWRLDVHVFNVVSLPAKTAH